jgi:hypothetical protein
MTNPSRPLPFLLAFFASLAAVSPLLAQSTSPSDPVLQARQQRVALLLDEIKAGDARVEQRLDLIVNTLVAVNDSKDSRTKVARMKQDTMEQIGKLITYCDQKRAALKQEVRSPRLHLTDDEKRTLIDAFDTRIEKRVNQVLALQKSMPTAKDYERYTPTSGGWLGTRYERNQDYEQNRRMTSYSNTQRNLIAKQLEASIARLDRLSRTLTAQSTTAADPAQRKALSDEIAKTNNLIAVRRQQRAELDQPTAGGSHTVALDEALDMDKALRAETDEVRRDLTTLFQNYNTYLQELSALHAAEAARPGARSAS